MSADWGPPGATYVPLFDRLVDEDIHQRHEQKPQRTLDRGGVIDSVGRELLRLFSTRCPIPGDAALARERSILDYGLPDLTEGGRATVPEQRLRLERLLRETIRAFEPRLANVHVTVRETGELSGRLTATVEGYLLTEAVNEPISFLLPVGNPAGADAG